MTWEAWFTLGTIVITVVVLVRDLLPPSVALAGATVAVLAAGVVTPAQALSGLSNPATMTIAALYVVAKAVENTGTLAPLVGSTIGDPSRQRSALARLLLPVAAASAFLNNTPIVAMLVPQVQTWAEKRGLQASRFLMPLSFAAILGGLVTLMGTATNIVISGLLESEGMEPLGFFEISPIGVPVAVVGLVAIVALSPVVLPVRRSPSQPGTTEFRDFTVGAVVVSEGPLDGITMREAGAKHLKGMYVAQLHREDTVIAPVPPSEILRGGDLLGFVERVDRSLDVHTVSGLDRAEKEHIDKLGARLATSFEAVVGASSPLVGETLRGFRFRGRYQAAVVAIHRAGERVGAKLADEPIRVGDTLLVVADRRWGERWSERGEFLLVSKLGVTVTTSRRSLIVVAIVAAMVTSAATGLVPLVTAALVAGGVLVMLRVVSPGEAGRAIDIDVIVIIAAAFGLAAAVVESGLADLVASGLIDGLGRFGPVAVLAGIVLATAVMTGLIANKAAVLLILPIALAAADSLAVDARAFAMAVAVAAATSFLTPIGYATNTMVYGPGGYRFTDYMRLGVPLTVLVLAMVLVLVPVLWPL